MEKNYTPLPQQEIKKNNKFLSILQKISQILFFISLLFFFVSFFTNKKSPLQKTKAGEQKEFIIWTPKFEKLSDIKFVPRKINDIELDKEKILEYYKNKYPNTDPSQLIELINKKIFAFFVINETNDYRLLKNFDGDLFEEKLASLITNYEKESEKITFYYFKVRFKGTTPENIKNLNLESSQLKEFARQKIEQYYQIEKSPDLLMENINKDKEILLINNNEPAGEKVEDYQYTTPIFDDFEFFEILHSLPLKTYSPIITLKTKNPYQEELEEYAFVFFYVEKKETGNPPLILKINEFIKKSSIL